MVGEAGRRIIGLEGDTARCLKGQPHGPPRGMAEERDVGLPRQDEASVFGGGFRPALLLELRALDRRAGVLARHHAADLDAGQRLPRVRRQHAARDRWRDAFRGAKGCAARRQQQAGQQYAEAELAEFSGADGWESDWHRGDKLSGAGGSDNTNKKCAAPDFAVLLLKVGSVFETVGLQTRPLWAGSSMVKAEGS